MRHVLAMCILCGGLWSIGGGEAHAAGYYGPRSEYSPSVFSYGFRGLGVGAIGGLSLGYIIARDDGFRSDDWATLGYGLGIGALGGGAIGLTLGFVDLADDRPGMGNVALRDMLYGGLFGIAAGAIGGGIAAISSGDPEHILFGASIGALSGVLVGLVVGVIEGRRIVDSPRHRYPARRLSPTLALVPDGSGRLSAVAGARARF